MSANPSVTIFNASPLSEQMQVNNSVTTFQILGADGTTWVPASAPAKSVTWSYDGPAQNVLGPGDNEVFITPGKGTRAFRTTIHMPDTQYTAIQLYIFFNSSKDVSWVVLDQGEFVAGSIKLTASPNALTATAAIDDAVDGEA